jgi:hypothetical protein
MSEYAGCTALAQENLRKMAANQNGPPKTDKEEGAKLWAGAANEHLVEQLRAWDGSRDNWVEHGGELLIDATLVFTLCGGLDKAWSDRITARIEEGESVAELLREAEQLANAS